MSGRTRTTMHAIVQDRYGSPDALRLTEVAVPEPGDGEVLVKVQAAALNTADLDHLRGRPALARVATGWRRPRSPRVGLDLAGRVAAVGAGVTRFSPGDEVFADLSEHGRGSLSEYVCAKEAAFVRRPASVAAEDAATLPHSGTLALQALRARRPIEPGEHVLINGAGGCVGPFAIQIARALGAEVTAVDTGAKHELMRSAGAHHLIDHTRQKLGAGGQHYDRILDIAATRSLLAFRRLLRPGGVFAVIPRSVAGFFGSIVLGAGLSRLTGRQMGTFMWRPNDAATLEELVSLLHAGALRPVIHDRIGLRDVPDALRCMEAGTARGRFVVAM